MKIIALTLIGFMIIVFSACRADDLIDDLTDNSDVGKDSLEYPDWTDATHSNQVDPDYYVVFNQNEVLRFDIVITEENWSDMQANLASILGSSSGAFPGPPPGDFNAGPPPRENSGSFKAGFPGGGGGGPGGGGPGGAADTENPDFFECSFKFDDKEWYNVGIRYKGNSSLRTAYQSGIKKISFKLDFDEFENDYPGLQNQRFYGFKQLNLNNNYDDPSLMREKVGADLFRSFGLISAQTSFCAVYIDYGSGPQYFGLYTLVEEVDDSVIKTQTGNDDGNLYKPEGNAATFAIGSYNESQFGKKNNEEINDYSDVKALYDIINTSTRTSDTELWKEELESVFNVDGFMKWLAANTVIQNWDTYGVMSHNYFLYNNPNNSMLSWIPWDNNEAFQSGKQGGALSFSMREVGNNWPLISYLHGDEEYEQIYNGYLQQFVNEVFDPNAMISTYSAYSELLQEYAYAEESGYTFLRSGSEFDQAVGTLKTHVQSRNNAVNSYLN